MPTHMDMPRGRRITWRDRVLTHPNDHAVAILATVFGVLMALTPLTGLGPSKVMEQMPLWLVFLSGASMALGGVLTLVGLQWPKEPVSDGWAIEQAGWSGVFAGLASYAIASAYVTTAPAGALIPAVLTAGAAVRWLSFFYIRANARAAVEDDPPEREG